MFHPAPSANGDNATNDEIYLSSIKLNIHQISTTLRSMYEILFLKLRVNITALVTNM